MSLHPLWRLRLQASVVMKVAARRPHLAMPEVNIALPLTHVELVVVSGAEILHLLLHLPLLLRHLPLA